MSSARVAALEATDERWQSDLRHYRHPDGSPIELFAHVAPNPRVLDDLRTATTACLTSEIPVRMRELLILRLCAATGCTSEWDTHVALFGAVAGLDEHELSLLQAGAPANVFAPEDRATIEAVDELLATDTLSDGSWTALGAVLTEFQALDFLMVAGQYLKVCWVANALGLNGQDPRAVHRSRHSWREH